MYHHTSDHHAPLLHTHTHTHTYSLAISATHASADNSKLWERILLPAEQERLLFAFFTLLFLRVRSEAQAGVCACDCIYIYIYVCVCVCVCVYVCVERWWMVDQPFQSSPSHSTPQTIATVGARSPLAVSTLADLFHFCITQRQHVQVAYQGG
jgi:hypothetical protein